MLSLFLYRFFFPFRFLFRFRFLFLFLFPFLFRIPVSRFSRRPNKTSRCIFVLRSERWIISLRVYPIITRVLDSLIGVKKVKLKITIAARKLNCVFSTQLPREGLRCGARSGYTCNSRLPNDLAWVRILDTMQCVDRFSLRWIRLKERTLRCGMLKIVREHMS